MVSHPQLIHLWRIRGIVIRLMKASIGTMSRRARPTYLLQIVNELLTGVNDSDKENETNEGRRDITCLGMLESRRRLKIKLTLDSSQGGCTGDAR